MPHSYVNGVAVVALLGSMLRHLALAQRAGSAVTPTPELVQRQEYLDTTIAENIEYLFEYIHGTPRRV